jgi:hypothetical protein
VDPGPLAAAPGAILQRALRTVGCGVSGVTGLFAFKMKVNGEGRPAIVEITAPGIPSEKVVHVVRGEWANLVVPGISQNRIECLGWDRVEAPPDGWVATEAIGPNRMIVWRPGVKLTTES